MLLKFRRSKHNVANKEDMKRMWGPSDEPLPLEDPYPRDIHDKTNKIIWG